MSEPTTNKPATPKKKRPAPKTYTCPTCRRRRPIEDQMDSCLEDQKVCQDCWDEE